MFLTNYSYQCHSLVNEKKKKKKKKKINFFIYNFFKKNFITNYSYQCHSIFN